jgi:hypothetical protein
MIQAPPNQDEVQKWDQVRNRWIVSPLWQLFFSNIFGSVTALQQSGTTAQRPTKGLYVGRPYFDTTLGYSINYNGTVWVDGAGTPV